MNAGGEFTGAPRKYVINVVCTGNICRSPMGEIILNAELKRRGLDRQAVAVSSGVSDEEQGSGIDPRSAARLKAHGYELAPHCAHQITPAESSQASLILPMTYHQVQQLKALLPATEYSKIHLYRSFDRKLVKKAGGKLNKLDIFDPWYGVPSDFDVAFTQIEQGARYIVDYVSRQLQSQPADR